MTATVTKVYETADCAFSGEAEVMSAGFLFAVLIIAIAMVVFLIVKVKLHASIALVIAAFGVALITGIAPGDVVKTVESGVGDTLGFLTLIIGFGAVLGKMLEVSGGAERLARTLLQTFGTQRAALVMSVVGLIAGIPVFVEVGFVLLVPLVFVVAKDAGVSRLQVGIPLAVSLMIVHCILPPHPAATAIVGMLGADIGTVIVAGLIVAIPASLIGGPLYARLAGLGQMQPAMVTQGAVPASSVEVDELSIGHDTLVDQIPTDTAPIRDLPGFGITLLTIMLPLLIMVGRTILLPLTAPESATAQVVSFLGNPITALLISVVFCYWSLGVRRGMASEMISRVTESSFSPIGGVLLIIGAGGGFNAVLIASGIAPALAEILAGLPVSPIILAWLIALMLHFAVGSATVAMISAAGIVLPLMKASGMSPEAATIAIGAGAIGLTHVTDSLFWMVKEYLQMSVEQALKTITVGTTIASLVGLVMALIIHIFI